MAKPESTGKKRALPEEMKKSMWTEGKSGNPNGRPKGSRNKFAENFIADFLADWEKNGPKALRNARRSDPAAYLRVAASIIPKEFNINDTTNNLDRFLDKCNDQELDSLIKGLTSLGAATKNQGSTTEEKTGKKSSSLH